jgi:hypothetical protein
MSDKKLEYILNYQLKSCIWVSFFVFSVGCYLFLWQQPRTLSGMIANFLHYDVNNNNNNNNPQCDLLFIHQDANESFFINSDNSSINFWLIKSKNNLIIKNPIFQKEKTYLLRSNINCSQIPDQKAVAILGKERMLSIFWKKIIH